MFVMIYLAKSIRLCAAAFLLSITIPILISAINNEGIHHPNVMWLAMLPFGAHFLLGSPTYSFLFLLFMFIEIFTISLFTPDSVYSRDLTVQRTFLYLLGAACQFSIGVIYETIRTKQQNKLDRMSHFSRQRVLEK